MERLKPQSKQVYQVNGIQLFSKVDLGKLLNVNRNTVQKNIEAWGVMPSAKDNRGFDLYEIHHYIVAQQRQSLSDDGSDKYGGFADALEWKNAISAQRDELRLMKDRGELCNAFEAEAEIAACLADVAMIGEALLTHVDNTLHPSGEDMELLSQKFKNENVKYYDRLMADTEHVA